MLVMFYKGATFVKNNSFLVARIVLFDAAGLYLLTFHISEPCLFKNIEQDLSHVSHSPYGGGSLVISRLLHMRLRLTSR